MAVLYNKATEEFRTNLPCNGCNYSKICKNAFAMEPVTAPENFTITVGCKDKEALDKLAKGGSL